MITIMMVTMTTMMLIIIVILTRGRGREAAVRERGGVIYKSEQVAPEGEFVHAITAGGSVKFLPAVQMSPFSLIFLCFFILKLLKLGEIDGVKFLA